MPIDLELNSALGNQTYFYQKCGSCTQKSNETWNLKIRVKIKKKHLWSKGSRWKVVGPKSLYIQDLRIHGSSIGHIRFSFWSFNFWPRSDFYHSSTQKVQIFHLKGRGDKSWLYNFWIAQLLNFFLWDSFFFISAIFFRWKKGSKLDQKCKLWVSPVFIQIWVF